MDVAEEIQTDPTSVNTMDVEEQDQTDPNTGCHHDSSSVSAGQGPIPKVIFFLEPPSGDNNSQRQLTTLQEDSATTNSAQTATNVEQHHPQTTSLSSAANAHIAHSLTTSLYSTICETPSGSSSFYATPPVSPNNDDISDLDTEDVKLLDELL